MSEDTGDGSVRGKGRESDPTRAGKVTVTSIRPGNAPSTVYMGQAAPPNVPFAVSPRPIVVDVDQAESAYSTPDSYNRYMTAEWKDWIDGLAKFIDYRRTGSSLWTDAINASQALQKQGIDVSPMKWLVDVAREKGFTSEAASAVENASNRNRVPGGPRATISLASERDLRSAVDAMASQVLGRAATEDEFQSALAQVRSAERSDPTISTRVGGTTVTESGLTAEGRSSIIRESLMKGPEAEEFGKATKMMDLFYSALEARPSGA